MTEPPSKPPFQFGLMWLFGLTVVVAVAVWEPVLAGLLAIPVSYYFASSWLVTWLFKTP